MNDAGTENLQIHSTLSTAKERGNKNTKEKRAVTSVNLLSMRTLRGCYGTIYGTWDMLMWQYVAHSYTLK